jgi:hypothetical protein
MVTPQVSFMHPLDFWFNTSAETFEVLSFIAVLSYTDVEGFSTYCAYPGFFISAGSVRANAVLGWHYALVSERPQARG